MLVGLIFCMETMNLFIKISMENVTGKSPNIAHNRQTRSEPRASNTWYIKGAIS